MRWDLLLTLALPYVAGALWGIWFVRRAVRRGRGTRSFLATFSTLASFLAIATTLPILFVVAFAHWPRPTLAAAGAVVLARIGRRVWLVYRARER